MALDEAQKAAYMIYMEGLESTLMTYEFNTDTVTLTGKTANHNNLVLIDESTADDNNIFRDQPASMTLNASSMSVFPGAHKQLAAELSPWCLRNKSITWSSADPKVATVDETGVVTGVSEGTVTITAASAQDESVKAQCAVTVYGTDFTLQGIGTNEEGESVLFTYDLNTGSISNQISVTNEDGNSLPVESAALAQDGTLWVQDNVADENGRGYRLYNIDPATGKATFTTPVNTNGVSTTSLLFSDLAVDSVQNIMLGVNGENRLFFSDAPNSNDLGGSWFNATGDGYVGITVGSSLSSGLTRFYDLDKAGKVIVNDISYSSFFGAWSTSMTYYNLNTSLEFVTDENDLYQDSVTYNKETDAVLLQHYTKDGTTEVYALVLKDGTDSTNGVAELIYLGEVKGFKNVDVYDAKYNGTAVTSASESTELQSQQVLLTTAGETVPQGSTNVATHTPEKDDDGIVTVTLRAEEASASGMLEVMLDENVTLVGLESPAALSSWTEKDGKVVFGYAGYEAVAKEGVIAVLRLKDVTEPAALTITETERGGKTPESEPVTVEIGHAWGEWTVTKEATCTEDGEETRTCALCDETETRTIPATGHSFGEWTVTTNPDCFHTGVETRICEICGEIETREIPASSDNCPAEAFTDLDTTKWYHKYTDFVLDNGIMNGVGNNKFAPNGAMTRGMVVTVLYRLAGEPEVKTEAPFADVPQNQWYAKAATWAYENGIAKGMTDTLFAPNAPATREQLVTFLYRYAKFSGMDTSAEADLTAFTDGTTVSGYAVEAMAWAVGSGLVEGMGNSKLTPKATAARVQLAALIYRLIK